MTDTKLTVFVGWLEMLLREYFVILFHIPDLFLVAYFAHYTPLNHRWLENWLGFVKRDFLISTMVNHHETAIWESMFAFSNDLKQIQVE